MPYQLTDIDIVEISLVDQAANNRVFVCKRAAEPDAAAPAKTAAGPVVDTAPSADELREIHEAIAAGLDALRALLP